MNYFLSNFFSALMVEFYALFFLCIIGFPIILIVALFQNDKATRSRWLALSAKLFLLSLLFFVVGFGSCVLMLDSMSP